MKNETKHSTLSDHFSESKIAVSKHTEEIRTEQIRLLFRLSNTAFLATPFLASILVLVHWNHVPRQWLFIWLISICLLTVVRYLHVRIYLKRKKPATDSKKPVNVFLIGTFLAGLHWGLAGGVFFVDESPVHILFLAYLLGGVVAGATSTLSSYRGAFLIFSVPVLLPFTYQVISHGGETHTAIAITYLLFLLLMIRISLWNYHTVADSLRLRFENSDLIDRLLSAKDQQLMTNQELEAQIEEKKHAEKALQTVNSQLEQRVIERTEALVQSNDKLVQEKELFKVTLASIGDAVITTDFVGNITYLNPTAELLTGWSNREVCGLPLQHAFQLTDVVTQSPIKDLLADDLKKTMRNGQNRECLLIRKNNQKSVINYVVAPIFDGKKNMIGSVLTFRDVTEQRELTQKLTYQATHDALTDLLNRNEFEVRLAQILKSTRENHSHALLYLDLDQFKVVNDTCGHDAGDELLRRVSALLHARLRHRDTFARLGGDEFGIILEHCPQEKALRIAHVLRELVQDFRFQWQDKTFTIGVSIGLFPINQTNINLAKALSAADSACYAAKDSGRNRIHVYQEKDSVLLKRSGEMQWLPRIRQAIEEQRFLLYYQPIMLTSQKKEPEEHGEILLRLQDEQGKLISPGVFLPSAERYNQMTMLDRWVVGSALKLLKAASQKQSKVIFAINLSSQSLGDEGFLDFVVERIKKENISPSSLCFEITENVALADLKHVTRFISTLKKLGCRFSMDDFGSGLSSFGYLKDLELDYLKIDGRLVKDMITDPVDRAMVEAIHNIGHVMKLKTIAEWVENDATQNLLKEMGVDYVQGFWLAKPYQIGSKMTDKNTHKK
ncbi:MAG TPA: EAL domain-containing protein [Nitrosomonas sp.]|nr:EAL domain-containing protein [Nitrosomonas sp.]